MRSLHQTLRPKVGATVPHAENPCYREGNYNADGTPKPGTAFVESLCRYYSEHPEKRLSGEAPRPHILIPKQLVAEARAKYAAEHGHEESWWDKPLAGDIHSPDRLPRALAYVSTPKHFAFGAVAVFTGIKVLA